MPMLEIYRARIDPADVDHVLEIRAAAVAEFQEQLPELLQADLVHLHDDVWLDVLVWSAEVDEDRVSRAAAAAGDSEALSRLVEEGRPRSRSACHAGGRGFESLQPLGSTCKSTIF
jgi:hypothetical protein